MNPAAQANQSLALQLGLPIEDQHQEHPWGIFFTILGTVLLDFDADSCQSPSRAYLLDVTVPGKTNTQLLSSIPCLNLSFPFRGPRGRPVHVHHHGRPGGRHRLRDGRRRLGMARYERGGESVLGMQIPTASEGVKKANPRPEERKGRPSGFVNIAPSDCVCSSHCVAKLTFLSLPPSKRREEATANLANKIPCVSTYMPPFFFPATYNGMPVDQSLPRPLIFSMRRPQQGISLRSARVTRLGSFSSASGHFIKEIKHVSITPYLQLVVSVGAHVRIE